MKKLIAKLFKPWSSNKNTKDFFYTLYSFSLFGLYGDEWHFERSGELTFLKSLLAYSKEREFVFFDVGANVGEYSYNVIKLFGSKNITVHAFEPSRTTYLTYAEKFKNASNVIKNNFGLSDARSETKLFTVDKSSGFASLYLDEGKKNFDGTEVISLRSLDEYCEEKRISKIHFMKIDVEGHELSVLMGARKMLEGKKIEAMQFEFGARNLSSRTYFHDFYSLLNDQYNLYRVVKNGLIRVDKYDYKLEVFGRALNYVAILKEADWSRVKV